MVSQSVAANIYYIVVAWAFVKLYCQNAYSMVPSLYRSGYPVTFLSDGPPMKAAQKQVGDLISRIRDTPDGESITLSVK
jgi:hypothetical protein